MLINYFKIALRNIKKNKLYSIISILGLALAIGCFTLPFVVVDFNNSIDKFHKHGDKIYYVLNNLGKSGGGKLWGFTPRPLGPALKNDFPQVTDHVRIDPELATIKIKDKIFRDTLFILISTSVLTVLSQILKAARMNIVDRLREE
jgi:putative ABC transport system permease protein